MTSHELADLMATLQSQRNHILGQVERLPEDLWTTPALPSGWTVLRLVHHLAADDERFWLRGVMADDSDAWASFPEGGETFWSELPHEMTPTDVLALYRAEIEASDRIIDAHDLDDEPLGLPDWMPLRMTSLRQVLLHLVTETAVHAGHLDAHVELLTGRLWISEASD